jgi:hypothetical protein
MKYKKILPIALILIVLFVWGGIAVLNFSYLSQFVEYSFYWIEVFVILYFILIKRLKSGNLFSIGMILLVAGALFSLFKLYLGEIILRISLVVWIFGTIVNLFENEKKV